MRTTNNIKKAKMYAQGQADTLGKVWFGWRDTGGALHIDDLAVAEAKMTDGERKQLHDDAEFIVYPNRDY